MATRASASCDECGWAGGPYRSEAQAAYALRQHSCDHHRTKQARAERVAARRAASGPRRECTCRIANHEHGTHVAYVVDHCRCRECRDANRAYEDRRRRDRAYGRQAYVPADHARTHVLHLMSQGMGNERIRTLAGIPGSTMTALLYGRAGRSGERIRATTEAKILAVTLDLADGARTSSTGTRRRLQALVHQGWSIARLAQQLDANRQRLDRILHDGETTVATHRAVVELYDRLWDQAPPQHDQRTRIAYSRARRYASDRGWVGPLAWDDETIDDPDATPDAGGTARQSGRPTALHLEDVEWLLDQEDFTWDGLASRLNVTRDAIGRALHRHDRSDLVARLTTNTRGYAA